jgi:hypothetical protein
MLRVDAEMRDSTPTFEAGETPALRPLVGAAATARLQQKTTATPKRLQIVTPAGWKCNLIFTSSLQISYNISGPAIFEVATDTA